MRLVPQTVRARVTIAATAAAVVVLAAAGWGLAVNLRRELTDNLDEQMANVASRIADALVEGTTPAVDGVGDDDWLIRVDAADGTVLAASESPPDDDDPTRSLTRTVDTPSGMATVVVTAPSDDIDDSVTTLQRSLLIAVPLAAVALGGLTWVLVGRTLRPVERIRAEVASIGGAELHHRVPVPPVDDEIGRLATTMNDMLARVDQAQQRQRRFVADASHELRGPLTRMRTELEVDLEHPATADPAATHRSVLDEVVGLQQLIDDLLLLARGDGDSRGVADAGVVDLAEVTALAARNLSGRDGVTVDVSVVTPAETVGRQGELQRAVANLLDNAVRHATSAVLVTVTPSNDTVSITVEDDGPGIPAADRERVFERFARADAARSAAHGGVGLGLSIAREIVERHGGALGVDATYEAGARLVLTLPTRQGGTR